MFQGTKHAAVRFSYRPKNLSCALIRKNLHWQEASSKEYQLMD